jgi:hypothetical protein
MNELIALLDELSCYNRRTSTLPGEAQEMRECYRVKLGQVLLEIGEGNLPPAIVEAFNSGRLLRERSSRYVDLMQAWRAIQALRPPVDNSHRNDRS